MRLIFQEAGDRFWILERRNGFARGTLYRMIADDRFIGRQSFAEIQRCLDTVITASGCSAFHLVCGLRMFADGATQARICFLRRTPLFRGSLRDSGNSA